MNRGIALISVAMTVASWTGFARADVAVSFINPERYTDISRDPAESDMELREIGDHLKLLGKKYLESGVNLRIEILDIDLAGIDEIIGRQARWTRVIRSDTWPRIALRYVLDADGRVLDSAEETITDMSYLSRVRLNLPTETLRYEKQMLDDWFRTRIVERRPSSR